jgi:photosystem II stability/assembly factor-like uncharacterized protein
MLLAMPLRLRFLLAAAAVALAFAGAPSPAHAGINSWTPLGLDGGQVVSLAVSPAEPGLIYAGCFQGGVSRSTDAGATWAAPTGLRDFGIISQVIVDSRTPSTVYVLATHTFDLDNGLWKSTNGGETWIALDLPGNVLAVAVDSRRPATLYAGTLCDGLFKSTDGGRSWGVLSLPGTFFDALAVDPAQPSIVYVVADEDPPRVERSLDGGATWSDKDAGLPLGLGRIEPLEFAFDTSTVPSTVYVTIPIDSGPPLTFRSTDAGGSWHAAGPGGQPLAAGPGVIYAGSVKSVDRGATWTPVAAPPGGALALLVPPGSPKELFAGTPRGVWLSRDGGSSWQAASNGLTATGAYALAVDPANPEKLYAVAENAVQGSPTILVKSADGGASWHRAAPYSYSGFVAVDPVTPTTLYLTTELGLAKSLDEGVHWQMLGTDAQPLEIYALALDPVHSGTLYGGGVLGSASCSAFKSDDGGQTWSCLSLDQDDVLALAVAPSAPAVVYALTENYRVYQTSLFRSSDAGVTWTNISDHLHLYGHFYAMAVDPTDANRAYLLAAKGLFRSTDGGGSWTEADHGPPPIYYGGVPAVLAIDPHAPEIVYAAAVDFGVYRSTDHGRTWNPILDGFPGGFGFGGALVPDPGRPGRVYAGTADSGLLTYTAE